MQFNNDAKFTIIKLLQNTKLSNKKHHENTQIAPELLDEN